MVCARIVKWDQKFYIFVAKALSHDLLTKVRKAKLKPKRARKGEPEDWELEQEQWPNGDEMRDGECERREHQCTACKHRYAIAQATEFHNQNSQPWQPTLQHLDENYDLNTELDRAR
jgi:hypothetical protein